jgi:hypothetical protein
MPICCRGADGVLDHIFWFRCERKPAAVVSMPYNGDRLLAQELAAQYGLIMQAPPIVNAGWVRSDHPGKNGGSECFVFVPPGTMVRWLPGQVDGAAYEKFVAVVDREKRLTRGFIS